MFARQLDCLIVPQLCVEGEEYESSLDDSAFTFAFEKRRAADYKTQKRLNRNKNVTGFLRNRELSGYRPNQQPQVTFDANSMDTFIRGYRSDGYDKYGRKMWSPLYHTLQTSTTENQRCFNDSNIAAISPTGSSLIRCRIDDEDDRVYDGRGRGAKLLYICALSPKYIVWALSMVLEDIPVAEQLSFIYSRRNGLVATVLMDTCAEEREARGPQQGVIRVDLLVPWAGVQLCTINTACLAQREDRQRRPIEKRCVRVHDRGVIINCGFQLIFITVTPKLLFPLAVAGEVRKSFYFQPTSYLGMQSNPGDAIEKRLDVDVGETLSCRYAIAFPARAHDHAMQTRLELAPHPGAPLAQRLQKHPDVGEPAHGSKLHMARQAVSIEALIAKFLSRWYAVQPVPAKYIGTMDYECDVLTINDAACTASVGVFVKAEVRYALPPKAEVREDEDDSQPRRVKSPREKTQFDVVYVEFDWLIIEGGPRNPRVCMRKAGIGNSEIFDKNRWYTGNPRERYEPHEVLQRESTKPIIELRPLLQPEMLLVQRSKRNRLNNSQEELSFDEMDPLDMDDDEEDSQEEAV